MKEQLIYYSVKFFAEFVRILPINLALAIGKGIGMIAYYLDPKHKSLAYANLNTAFAHEKNPGEIKKITKKLFQNYGQNLIELLRMPLLSSEKFKDILTIEGKENIHESLKQNKGVILLAMHFGSWEIASLSCAMLGHPYKVLVKPQQKYSKLD
ncbi:MAG: hypothetical protein KC713_09155, partial [Candidatus Omnitrophica bacterium]|nr:hypothetical protein [Candidatus Omnitrophota bacterium]